MWPYEWLPPLYTVTSNISTKATTWNHSQDLCLSVITIDVWCFQSLYWTVIVCFSGLVSMQAGWPQRLTSDHLYWNGKKIQTYIYYTYTVGAALKRGARAYICTLGLTLDNAHSHARYLQLYLCFTVHLWPLCFFLLFISYMCNYLCFYIICLSMLVFIFNRATESYC